MNRLFGKKFITILLIGCFVFIANSQPYTLKNTKVRTIVIDAGHGGKDPGCIGYGKDVMEKDVALDIALRIGKYLDDSLSNVKIIYTRKTDNFVPLFERAANANKNNADLFISIHCNANESKIPTGTETYIMGLHKTEGNLEVSKRENQAILLEEGYKENEAYQGFDPNSDEAHIIFSLYQNAYRNQSLILASKFQHEVEKRKIRPNRGVKEAGFLVLWKTTMPSILVETGFLTNPDDKKFLTSDDGKDEIALSVMEAVKGYVKELN